MLEEVKQCTIMMLWCETAAQVLQKVLPYAALLSWVIMTYYCHLNFTFMCMYECVRIALCGVVTHVQVGMCICAPFHGGHELWSLFEHAARLVASKPK